MHPVTIASFRSPDGLFAYAPAGTTEAAMHAMTGITFKKNSTLTLTSRADGLAGIGSAGSVLDEIAANGLHVVRPGGPFVTRLAPTPIAALRR